MTTFVPPTKEELLDQFPIFQDVEDTQLDWALAFAVKYSSDDWDADDHRQAVMLVAAHILSVVPQLQPDQSSELGADSLLSGLKSVSFGDLSFGFQSQNSKSEASSTNFESTIYGQLYQQLLTRNVVPVFIV